MIEFTSFVGFVVVVVVVIIVAIIVVIIVIISRLHHVWTIHLNMRVRVRECARV